MLNGPQRPSKQRYERENIERERILTQQSVGILFFVDQYISMDK